MRCRLRYFLLLALLAPGLLHAQVQRRMLNQSFEDPALATDGCRVYIDEARVTGWTTNADQAAEQNVAGPGGLCNVPAGFPRNNVRLIELWNTPRNNSSGGTVYAPDGDQIAELNAVKESKLYQNVCLINGETFTWRFAHRGRSNPDTQTPPVPYDVARFEVGTSTPIATVSTNNSGGFLAPIAGAGATLNAPTLIPDTHPSAPANNPRTWVRYSGTYQYSGATGVTSLGFIAIAASGGTANGNLLDDIQIELAPFVDFVQPTYSAPESAGNNLPQLRINGMVYAPMTVNVSITGGTATLGTDYTTPGNSSTLALTIPAGNYDGVSASSFFALPVTIVNDSIVEGNETIQFQVQQSTSSPQTYYRRSNTNCGQAGIVDTIYTIIGDDVQLAVTKNASVPVPVPGQADRFDISFTIVVNNTSTTSSANYRLQDVTGFDPDVSIVGGSASYTLNGGTANNLPNASSWTFPSPSQWNTLAPSATDTYVISVRGSIRRTGGSTSDDACTVPSTSGRGLHNVATATLQGQNSNQTFSSIACQPTPTPYWIRLRKQFVDRTQSTDQAQVRIYNGGILATTATTTGANLAAATSVVPYAAGTTIDLRETVLLNGDSTTPVAPANRYAVSIACTNARANATTVLPSGAGTTASNEHAWFEFGPLGGDDIDCTITNTPKADLSITKSNGTSSVTAGGSTTYTLTVSNAGPADATGAVLKDTVGSGLTCTSVTCTGATNATCPTTGVTWANLTGGGITLPTIQSGGSVTFEVGCSVSP